ncbi:MAG: lipoyl synthase [Deltaproteobacteria bacterium]|nr:lipoyl synthase [Deltaproteobacteria bacterium]
MLLYMPSTAHAPLRLPERFRKHTGTTADRARVHALMRAGGLSSVCEEARCPNIGECFKAGTATFMILGDRCTRRCGFCSVTTGRPRAPDPAEPAELARAVDALGLRHVVLTSVDRDDLKDKGAHHWAACIRAVKGAVAPRGGSVEVLTPDFAGDPALIDVVLDAAPDVFNHNMETVERLYKAVRPQSSWETTLGVLRHVAGRGHGAVKSGIMVGLGETDDEVRATLATMRGLGVHIATLGQYLRPTLKHWPVDRYVDDDAYDAWRAFGLGLGFTHVFAGPFVRSSYHAAEALAHHQHGPAAPAPPRRGLPILA